MGKGFTVDIDDGVGRVTLDRPDKHNAFDDFLIAALTYAFVDLDQNPAVDVVVLASKGKSFSAGGDLDWMKRAAQHERSDNIADARALARLMRTLDRLSKPTVCAVQGPAYGGGVGLVACCDIAIAADTAKFALSEVKLGLIPAAIGPYVVRAIGPRQARRYFQTAEVFEAVQAMNIGLVHEVVDADQLEERVQAIASVLRGNAPEARKAAKRLISDIAFGELNDALTNMTAERIADIRSRDEAKEGLAAFFERRKPNWISESDSQ